MDDARNLTGRFKVLDAWRRGADGLWRIAARYSARFGRAPSKSH